METYPHEFDARRYIPEIKIQVFCYYFVKIYKLSI